MKAGLVPGQVGDGGGYAPAYGCPAGTAAVSLALGRHARPRCSVLRDRRVVGGARLGAAAQPAQQVGADRVEEVVARRGRGASTRPARRLGPSTSATATARLSATTGLGVERQQLVVEREDLPPVGVGRRRRASLCTALIAAWIWYGPGSPRRRHAPHERLPLGDQLAVPAARGPGRPAARARRPRSCARAPARLDRAASARAARAPRARPASARRAAGRAGSPRRTGPSRTSASPELAV